MAIIPDDLYALVSVMAGLVAFIAAAAVINRVVQRRYTRRLRSIYDRAAAADGIADAARQSLTRLASTTPNIDRVARRWLPRRDVLAARLARTGRAISVGQYLVTILGVGTATMLATVALTRLGLLSGALLGVSVGLLLPHMIVGRLGNRRVAAFINLFPEAIDLMVRALRSGLPVSEAIINAGHEVADPVGSELRMVESGMRLGRDLDSLLWDIAKRIDAPEFQFFIIAMSVQRETGGNLAETLGNLAESLRRRRQMRAKVRAMSSETRATTIILGGLPVVVVGLLALTSPDYLRPLLHDVRGYVLDGIAVAMLVTGVAIMTRMARFEI
jgi:tight adherence protein B